MMWIFREKAMDRPAGRKPLSEAGNRQISQTATLVDPESRINAVIKASVIIVDLPEPIAHTS